MASTIGRHQGRLMSTRMGPNDLLASKEQGKPWHRAKLRFWRQCSCCRLRWPLILCTWVCRLAIVARHIDLWDASVRLCASFFAVLLFLVKTGHKLTIWCLCSHGVNEIIHWIHHELFCVHFLLLTLFDERWWFWGARVSCLGGA